MTHPRHTIIPPYLLRHLAESADDSVAARAESTLRVDQTFRSDRRAVAAQATFRPTAITVAAAPNREISTAKNARRLPGTVVRREGEAATGDAAADRVAADLVAGTERSCDDLAVLCIQRTA